MIGNAQFWGRFRYPRFVWILFFVDLARGTEFPAFGVVFGRGTLSFDWRHTFANRGDCGFSTVRLLWGRFVALSWHSVFRYRYT